MKDGWESKRIIHLDDHEIALTSAAKALRELAPGINIESYSNSDDAFDLLIISIVNNQSVDLFITDFVHSGLDGYEMCKSIRAIERDLEKSPIPILLLTMLESSDFMIQKGLEEKVFNTHLALNSVPEKILNEIEALLKQ